MNFERIWSTIKHLRGKQFLFQVFYRVYRPKYKDYTAPGIVSHIILKTEPIARDKCLYNQSFTFLNRSHPFTGWNFTDNGMLWAYNQNYFDWINQKEFSQKEACQWIDQFIMELPENKVGLDPYPIALRCVNWVKFFCSHPETATKPRLDSLWSQYKLLECKLEYHLLGNHLLEDAFSLTVGAYYFDDEHMRRKGIKLLLRELKEQILPDGAHYEQSPMYHCILLDRLLDTYNVTKLEELIPYTQRMLGHLESICYNDDTWPFFGDAALGIAPTPQDIKDYARRLGLSWEALPLKECGYRKMHSKRMEAFVDVGSITASYQPGHSHADAGNYELRVDGKPFIIETGISTYDKTPRRQYERSTAAHNCVSVNGQDSSEVWGGFRVGNRCKATIQRDTPTEITIMHNGFSKSYARTFKMTEEGFHVEDYYDGDAISYIHLSEDADKRRVVIEEATSIEEFTEKASIEYNRFIPCQVLKIHFNGHLAYRIH